MENQIAKPTITGVSLVRMPENDRGDILAYRAFGRVRELNKRAYVDLDFTQSFAPEQMKAFAERAIADWVIGQPEWK